MIISININRDKKSFFQNIFVMFLKPFNPGEKVYEGLCTDLAGLRESNTVFMCGNMSLFKHLTPWSITISGINNITLRIWSN